jgi:hypothetical protein
VAELAIRTNLAGAHPAELENAAALELLDRDYAEIDDAEPATTLSPAVFSGMRRNYSVSRP